MENPGSLPFPLILSESRRQRVKALHLQIVRVVLVAVQQNHDPAKHPPHLVEEIGVLGTHRQSSRMSKGRSNGKFGGPGVERKALAGAGLYRWLATDLLFNGSGIQTHARGRAPSSPHPSVGHTHGSSPHHPRATVVVQNMVSNPTRCHHQGHRSRIVHPRAPCSNNLCLERIAERTVADTLSLGLWHLGVVHHRKQGSVIVGRYAGREAVALSKSRTHATDVPPPLQPLLRLHCTICAFEYSKHRSIPPFPLQSLHQPLEFSRLKLFQDRSPLLPQLCSQVPVGDALYRPRHCRSLPILMDSPGKAVLSDTIR